MGGAPEARAFSPRISEAKTLQRRSILAISILTIALFTAPSALGSWKSLGGYEPDTRNDELDGWMYLGPNQGVERKVYLNVVPSNPDLAANPNVAALGSRIQPIGKMGFEAFYGVWIDCNKDGYIGHAETALFEYRSELLIDQSLCPLGSDHNVRDANPVASGWVSELRWIAPPTGVDQNGDGIPEGRDRRIYHDLGARVWGDVGVPGDTMGGERCVPVEPVNATGTFRGAPRGTYRSTGAFLDYADCYTGHTGFRVAHTGLNAVGLGFDAEHVEKESFNQEGHPLNQKTLGRSDHNDTMMRVYDCSGRRDRVQTGMSDVKTEDGNLALGYRSPFLVVTNDKGELSPAVHWNRSLGSSSSSRVTGAEPSYRLPAPGAANTGGSVAGTYAHVTRGYGTECDPGDKGGDIYSYNEGDVVSEIASAKNRVTVRFGFYEEQRSGTGQRGNPFEGGAYPGMRGVGLVIASGSRWYWEADTNDPPVLPQLVRADDFSFQGATYWTFYANMSASLITQNGLKLAAASPGSYGDDWCQGDRTNVVRGFVCDPNQWYRGVDGLPARDTSGRPLLDYYPKVGHTYHLRDVDCFDASIMRGVPVYAGATLLSEDGPCDDALTPS